MTVNAELQQKIEELSRANNDMKNLLAGTGIGTVFVDHGMLIQRFTPAATAGHQPHPERCRPAHQRHRHEPRRRP